MYKILINVLILFCFSLYGKVFTQDLNLKEKDFSTPESTIRYFIESLKNNDISKVLEACAINEYSEKYSFTAYTKRINAMILHNSLAPSEYPMFVEINKLERAYRLVTQIKFFCYYMLSSEKVNGLVISEPGDERIASFITAINPERLKNLKIIDISLAVPSMKNDEILIKTFTEQAKIYGADEKAEFVILYKLENKYYLSSFTLLRYDKRWKIESLYSSLANLSPLEVVRESSLSEFEAFISE